MTEGVQVPGATVADVVNKILAGEKFHILDVRNEDAYANWRIEGDTVTSSNVPYFDLIDGLEPLAGKLPDNIPVVIVCAKEGSSRFVAEQMVEAGHDNVSVMLGGMQEWSEYLHPVKVGDVAVGAIYQFVRVGKGCLSYMIVSDGQAAVVDAGRMTGVYEQFAASLGARITTVVDTHLHADHISGGRQLAQQNGTVYRLPPRDAAEVTYGYQPLHSGEEIRVGAARLVPLYSPGHTIGSTSLIVDDKYLLSGDILFVRSIGRPDLAGKAGDWAGDLRTTLYQTYRKLAVDLVVLPAHYADSSELDAEGKVAAKLGALYGNNVGLRMTEETEFRRAVTENLPPQPNAYQEIRMINMGRIPAGNEEEQQEMEIGPNRCAIHG